MLFISILDAACHVMHAAAIATWIYFCSALRPFALFPRLPKLDLHLLKNLPSQHLSLNEKIFNTRQQFFKMLFDT